MTPAYLYVYASVDVGLKCRRSNGIDKSDTLILFFFSLCDLFVWFVYGVWVVCVCVLRIWIGNILFYFLRLKIDFISTVIPKLLFSQ